MDLERYSKKPKDMVMIQREIEMGANSVKVARTPRWPLSPAALEVILADLEKRKASVKMRVINAEDKD